MHPRGSARRLSLTSLATIGLCLVTLSAAAANSSAQSLKRSSSAISDRVVKLEASAQKCRTAEEAVTIYRIFLADESISAKERADSERYLTIWQKLASEDSVRVGQKWVPRAEELEMREQADKLVVQGLVLLQNGNLKEADKLLEKAAKVYPEHLDSLFLLAVGALVNGNASNAERQLSRMLLRDPQNIAILNNLAVAEAMKGQGDDAFKHLELAAKLAPDHGQTLQNLGALVFLFEHGGRTRKPVKASAGTKRKAALVFAELRTTSKAQYDPGKLFAMDFSLPGSEAKESTEPLPTERIVGNGTGFVVAPEYLLTNRHVIDDADSLVIVDPQDPQKLLRCAVVEKSEEFDLAILKCPNLMASPVRLNDASVARGTEVLALGFPIASVIGADIKATRGIVTGLPTKDTENMLVLDVQINPGNSGGPLSDRSGRIVGVNSATTFSDRFTKGYGLAIPISDAMPFLKQHVPDFAVVPSEEKNLEWTEVDAAVAPSTVMILVQKNAPTPGK